MGAVPPAERLEAEFRRIRSRLRRIALWTGSAWCAAAAIGWCLLIGAMDWYWHIDAVGVRRALLIGGGCLWGLLLLLRVILPAVRRPSAAELAARIERARPHWRGALVSSVEFLQTRCRPETGAPALQSSLIARSAALLDESDFQPLVRLRELRIAVAAAVLLSLLAAAIAIADPASAGLALARSLSPGSAPAWPRQHTLVLLDASFRPLDAQHPARPGAIGERMRVYVDDVRGRLPDEVTLQIATPDGGRRDQSLERTTIAGGDGGRREIGVAVLPAGSPTLRVRATGGDDDRMPWHTFEFVTRPTVRRFTMQLTPPEYTGLPAGQTVTTGGDVTALVGTRVRIDAELDMPVREAEFRHNGLPPAASRLSDDGRLFRVEFPIPAAAGGTYAIHLLSRDGLRSAHTAGYRVEGIADREPAVALVQPPLDLTVTPRAMLPLRIEAADDLGLVYVRLSIAEPPGSSGEQLRPLPLESPLPREALIDTQLAIAELGLEPGRRLVLRAEAADAYNLDGRHIMRSVPRTLSIVSVDEKLRELVARQSGIAEVLEQSVERQARALQQTRQLRLQWQASSKLTMSDIESLRRMAQDQPQITNELHADEQGGLPQVRRILEEFDWNRIDDAPTVERLTHLRRELERLKSEIAPQLDHSASLAVRIVTSDGAAESGALGDVLSELEDEQATAGDLLAALSEQFSEWRRRHDLTRSIAELVSEQSQVNRETRDTGRRTLATPLAELPPDERAGLARIAQRQAQIGNRLDDFEKQLREATLEPVTGEDDRTLPAADVQRALELLKGDAVAADMRRAVQLIGKNSIAEAVAAQSAVAEALEQLEEAVRGLNSSSPETLLRQAERAQREAETLQQRQEQLHNGVERMSAAAVTGEADSLRREQQELADETSQWARRLRRERLGDAAASAHEASAEMQAAASQLGDDDLPAAAAEQRAAVEKLQEAQRRLAARRQELEFDQTLSEWSRVAALLETFAERQAQLHGETARLLTEQTSKQTLSRAQLRSVLGHGAAQTQLADDVDELGASPEGSPVIREALTAAVERMRAAAAVLSEPRLDDAVRTAQQDALNRLSSLLDDLRAGTPSAAADRQLAEPGDIPATASNWPLATQLKMLARLQRDISQRESAIRAELSAEQTPSSEQVDELRQLADRQGRLAGILRQLLDDGNNRETGE